MGKNVLTDSNWMFITIFSATFFWMLLVVIFFIIMMRKFTFRPPAIKDEEGNVIHNPHIKETMAMPRGTIRFVLTITLLFAVIIMELINNIYDITAQIEGIMNAFHMVLAFYFGANIISQVANSGTRKTETIEAGEQAPGNGKQTAGLQLKNKYADDDEAEG